MTHIQQLLLFTHNPGKAAEFAGFLTQGDLETRRLQFLSPRDISPLLSSPEETGTTFEQNAIIKAMYGAHASGYCTLADDSGLCVDALQGGPGVRSSRFAEDHSYRPDEALRADGSINHNEANNLLMMQQLRDIPYAQRHAHFVSSIALTLPRDMLPVNASSTITGVRIVDSKDVLDPAWIAVIATGSTEGLILDEPQGGHGFGYDPIFYSVDLNKSFGLASAEEKRGVSHRARALARLCDFLCAENLI